jgi:hypothetical protein
MLPDRLPALAVVSLAVASACTPRVPAVTPPAPRSSEPAFEGEPIVLSGYLGRSPIDAELFATDAGFHGCYRELGVNSHERLDGALGARMTRETHADADENGWTQEDSDEAEQQEFDCRFEARSDIVRLGSVVAHCTPFVEPASNRPTWQIEGEFFDTKGGDRTPFYLAPAAYAGLPDALVLALVRADAASHACVPFIDVLDVKSLPGEREAVLYERSFPCEHQPANTGEAAPEPAPPGLRLALFPRGEPAHPHVAVIPGIDDADSMLLAVYELAKGIEIFEVVRRDEGSSSRTGRSWVSERRTLFTLTRGGRAGPLLDLPELGYGDGCEPAESLNLFSAELDGEPPAELVVELELDPQPCTENADAPAEPHDFTDTAYEFDPEMARFVPLSVDSAEIRRRALAKLDDAAQADETWRAPRAESACTARPAK